MMRNATVSVIRFRGRSLIVLGLAMTVLAPVLAAAESVLEEVIVTAQKRDESLQSVPIAVTAISGDTLDAMGATSFLDYALMVPSLSFGFSGIEGRATRDQISIRGISGGGTTATYVNETLVPTGMSFRLIDVQNVEVLRGPQGTLYGASAMGGLVKVVTKRPDDTEFAGEVAATAGGLSQSSDMDYSIEGVVNIPIREGVGATRVAAYYSQEAGFIDRIFGQPLPYAPEIPTDELTKGTARDVNSSEIYGIRVVSLFTPSAGWRIQPSFQWQRLLEDGATDTDTSEKNRGLQYRSFNIEEPLEEDAWLAELAVSYQGDGYSVVSSTSYWSRDFTEYEDDTEAIDSFLRGDYADPNVPPYPSVILNDWSQESFQQEVRLNWEFGSNFNWLLGGYFIRGESLREIRFSMPGWSDEPRYFEPGLGDLLFSTDGAGRNTDMAVFTTLEYALRDDLTLSAGVRYFDHDTRNTGDETGLFAGNTGPFVHTASETGTTPRFGIDYQASDTLLIYASAAKGYRNGGTQSPLPPQCLEEAAAVGVSIGKFESDSTWNYEIGIKSRLADRATVNASLYWIEWSGLQQTVRLPSCGFSRTGNVGEVQIPGGEVEVQLAVTDSLSLSASFGVLDAEVTDPGVGTRSEKGDKPLNVADFNAAASLSYDFSVSANTAGFARVDYQYLGESFTTFNQTEPVPVSQSQPYRRRPAFSQLNLRVGVRPNDRMEITLYGDNLTDESANFGEIAPIGVERADRPRFVTNRPRSYGIEFRQRF